MSGEQYREPDLLENPVQELKKLVKGYQKISGSRLIGEKMNIANNSSKSFNVFIEGLKKVLDSNMG